MKEEKLKEAFSKIKEDILNLGKEISSIREQLLETNSLMRQINEDIIKIKLEKINENVDFQYKETPTHTPTDEPKTPTNFATPTDNPTDAWEIGGLKSPNLPISIGNEGVPTDRQTNQQTDQHIFRQMFYPQKLEEKPQLNTTTIEQQPKTQENVVYKKIEEKPIKQQISEAADILDSLDAIKKEIRRKFKRITRQEMLVFSTIYQIEEQDTKDEGVNYRKIAIKLGLSESSIRDYVHKMIEKGIPIDKEKLNNKQIILHISPELKKIASLNTIITLREI